MKPITLTFDAFKDLMVNDVALREEITHTSDIIAQVFVHCKCLFEIFLFFSHLALRTLLLYNKYR